MTTDAPAEQHPPTSAPAIAQAEAGEHGVGAYVSAFRQRIRNGDLGALPVVLGLIAIWAIFFLLNERFLHPINVTNLMLQIAATGTIAVGVVLVLLLGEIDLSVAAVSGLAAAAMGVLSVQMGWPGAAAIAAALAVGLAIGVFNGVWITRFAVPSFVVTLAGLLAWQGAHLLVLGPTGTININDASITMIARSFLPTSVAWALATIVVASFAGAQLAGRRSRAAAGLATIPAWLVVVRIGLVSLISVGLVAFLGRDRGFPVALLILLVLVVVFDVITRRTPFGRHIFAVGGNAEAARRAGISVDRVRIAVFALASALAAFGGVIAAARSLAVSQSSGGGDLLLNAIAAAVIGGTSLFGGRGTVWAALLGALVIGSISNGMDLQGYASPIKFLVTGGVLLLAVTVDALSRRSRKATGTA